MLSLPKALWSLCILHLFLFTRIDSAHGRAHAHKRKKLGTELSNFGTAELLKEVQSRRQSSKVWMSPQEISLIESYLEPTDTMLEWGSGYSTLWYSQFVKSYYSIEHDQNWSEQMSSQIGSTGKVHYLSAPVEKGHKGWLGGFDEGTYEQFEEYIKKVDEFKVSKFDKVLIDGRARAICAEYILKYLHPKSLVFIHDYNPRHLYHQAADMFYDKVAEVYEDQSVVVLRPKAEALTKAASGGTLKTDFGNLSARSLGL